MYSNNIVNFQESTILNAHAKKSENLSNAPHIPSGGYNIYSLYDSFWGQERIMQFKI